MREEGLRIRISVAAFGLMLVAAGCAKDGNATPKVETPAASASATTEPNVLATVAGPGPIAADTSKDAYLRRAGLDQTLVDAYRERFRLRAARYVQWIAVPLAVLGTFDADGFLRRFLGSWLGVMAIAIPVGWITGWFPPDRIVTFGFAVPIAAAISLVWILRRHTNHAWVTRVVVVLLAGWMIVGALLAWGRQRPFVSVEEAGLTRYTALLAAALPEGTPIVYLVDDDDAERLGGRHADLPAGFGRPLTDALEQPVHVLDLAGMGTERLELPVERVGHVDPGVGVVAPEQVQPADAVLGQPGPGQPREGHRVAGGRVGRIHGGHARRAVPVGSAP